MTTKDQNKLAAIYAPLLVFIACFIVIVFSISQIIGMAKSVARCQSSTK
ncbi:hypothetical protein [Legionella sp. 16cNR16C]|nr:hypothetical protein [Legionella sp. 16cNR16C]MCE3046046.1 hypothetical protein [Legionella sp. 16cNR16C]